MRVVADKLNRVMNCNGSVHMPSSFPDAGDDDPTARDEGIAAHYMAQTAFSGAFTVDELIDRKAENGFYMTADMAEHVTFYLKSLDFGTMETDTSYNGDGWSVAGRCDHEKYDPTIDTQYVDDFKYGWRIKEAVGNWTLVSHAIGLAIKRGAWPAWSVLRIHQPRPHHPDGKLREWRVDAATLYAMYECIAATLAAPSDVLTTGLSWCQGCHAFWDCPAARKAEYNAIDAADVAYTDTLSDEALAHSLDTLRIAEATIKARREATEELARHRLKAGAIITPQPGMSYALENSYGHRKWKPGITAAMVEALTGKKVATAPGLITPAAAERAGIDPVTIAAFTDRPLTGVKLVKRNVDATARRMFGAK